MLLKVLCTQHGSRGRTKSAKQSTLSRGQNPLRCCDYGLAPRFRAVLIRHMGSPLTLSLCDFWLWFRYPQQPAVRLSARAYASTVSYRRSRRGTEYERVFCPAYVVLPSRVNRSCNCLPPTLRMLHSPLASCVRFALIQYLVSRLIGKPAKPRPIVHRTGRYSCTGHRHRTRLLKSGGVKRV